MGAYTELLGLDMRVTSIERAVECLVEDKDVLDDVKAKGPEAQEELLRRMLGEFGFDLDEEWPDRKEITEAYIYSNYFEPGEYKHDDLLIRIAPAILEGSMIMFASGYADGEIYRYAYREESCFFEKINILNEATWTNLTDPPRLLTVD